MTRAVPIACNLDALSPDERRQRASLAKKIRAGVVDICETHDGFRLNLGSDPMLYRDALDLVFLERRCCPFLKMKLAFSPEDGPVYFDLGGSAEIKAFLVSNGVLGCSN